MGQNGKLLTQIMNNLGKPSKVRMPKNQWQTPGQITDINSRFITMEGVGFPAIGQSPDGTVKFMESGKNYEFPTAPVREIPLMGKMKKGGQRTYNLPKAQLGTHMLTPDYRQVGENIMEMLSVPQKAVTALFSGKYQTPAEALNIKNPWVAFAVNGFLDPANIVGGTATAKIAKAVTKANKVAKPAVSSAVKNIANKFKSEIDWGKWNSEIPSNQALMQEYNAIEQTSKAKGTWMKNPDGSAFKGTPEQFVQQNSKNFKKAFGKSKLLNSDGSPTIQYHGSAKKFDIFDESKFQLGDAGYSGRGIYTTPDKNKASSYALSSKSIHTGEFEPTIYQLYGQGNNPISAEELIKQNKNYDLFNFHRPKDFRGNVPLEEQLLDYDVAIRNQTRGIERVSPWNEASELVFPTNKQLKSAVGNNGMFDMTNPNIYKALLPGVLGVGAATAINKKKNGGGLLSKKVTCSNCSHSWKSVDGGIDPLICHNCGGTIKMANGGDLPKFQSTGEYLPPWARPIPRDTGDIASGVPKATMLKTKQEADREALINKAYNNGTIKTATKQNPVKKAIAIAAHPMTAASYVAKGQRIPDNFEKGNTNTYDLATTILNPTSIAYGAVEIPGNIERGEYLQAGMNALAALPMTKAIRPLVSKALLPVKSYGKDIAYSLKNSRSLPTYKNVTRWEPDKVPEFLKQNAQQLTDQQKSLTGSWYTYKPKEQLGFYVQTRPGAGKVNVLRMSDRQIGDLEKAMPDYAKGMSGKTTNTATSNSHLTGELIVPKDLRAKAKEFRFDVNPSTYALPEGVDPRSMYGRDQIGNFTTDVINSNYKDILGMIPRKYFPFEQGGEMIRRENGSYSRRGLWDNIRANKGSGKKPTKEMLKQEHKIKAKQMKNGGRYPMMQPGGIVDEGSASGQPTTFKGAGIASKPLPLGFNFAANQDNMYNLKYNINASGAQNNGKFQINDPRHLLELQLLEKILGDKRSLNIKAEKSKSNLNLGLTGATPLFGGNLALSGNYNKAYSKPVEQMPEEQANFMRTPSKSNSNFGVNATWSGKPFGKNGPNTKIGFTVGNGSGQEDFAKGGESRYNEANMLSQMGYGGYYNPIMAEGGEANGEMAMGQMAAVSDKMAKLLKFVRPEQNLDPWIASKLAVMDHSADAISDYLTYGPDASNQMQEMQYGGDTDEMPSPEEIIQAYAEYSATPEENIIKELQARSEEEQQSMLMQMYKEIVEAQQNDVPEPSEEEEPEEEEGEVEEVEEEESPLQEAQEEAGEEEPEGPYDPMFRSGGYIGYDGKRHISKTPTWSGNTGYQKGGQTDDSVLENIAEILDPSGITSWDDVYRSYKKSGFSPETNLEIFGAMPLLGKVGQLGKYLGKAGKAVAVTARQKRNVDAFGKTLQAVPYIGRGTDATQAIQQSRTSPIMPNFRMDNMPFEMGGYIPEFMSGGISINPANKGKFTASAQSAGMGVQEFANHVMANKEDYSSTQVKRANFARNAAKWNKKNGGLVEGGVYDVTEKELQDLINQGYQYVKI